MVIRKSLDNELDSIKQKLRQMGTLAETALKDAVEALNTKNVSLAEKVMEEDKKINMMEDEIEQQVVHLIAAQQPVASDLRKIMATLKITTSVERIGDFAVDIAKVVHRLGNEEFIKPLQDIPAMATIVQTMIREVLKAYVDDNVDLAREMAEMDDKVDKLYASIVQDLLKRMLDHPDKMDQVIQLAFVARYLERTGDYVTNIAEAIIYSVKGKRVNLNQ